MKMEEAFACKRAFHCFCIFWKT